MEGMANVNLLGTSFYISNDVQFIKPDDGIVGYRSAGAESINNTHQVVDLTGGGFCGGNYPSVDGEYRYKLAFI